MQEQLIAESDSCSQSWEQLSRDWVQLSCGFIINFCVKKSGKCGNPMMFVAFGITKLLNFHKSHASRQQDDTYLMKKQYLCSPIMGERLRIPVDEYGIAVSLAGHGGS